MLQYLNELCDILEKFSLNKDDVVIVGSGAIAAKGIRVNGDLEIAIRPNVLKRMPFFNPAVRWHVALSDNIDCFRNQFWNIGISDDDIFKDALFIRVDGFKIVLLEIEFLYKLSLNRPKDCNDLILIRNFDKKIDNTSIKYKRNWLKRFINRIFCKISLKLH